MKQNVVDDYNLISGQQKAAILMLSLDEERSSSLFSLMDDEEIKELSVIMASLGKVNAGVVEQLFQEFTDRLSSNSSLIGTYETTERLLSKALDKDRVSAIMDEISGPAGRTMWDKLGNVNEHVLANYLKNEYPPESLPVSSGSNTEAWKQSRRPSGRPDPTLHTPGSTARPGGRRVSVPSLKSHALRPKSAGHGSDHPLNHTV